MKETRIILESWKRKLVDKNDKMIETDRPLTSGVEMAEDYINGNTEIKSKSGNLKFRHRWGPSHNGAKELANLYTIGKRNQELVAITISCFLFFLDSVILLYSINRIDPCTVLLACISGMGAADFLSGLVHWLADTWGSVEIPLFGKNCIRPFREHHIDPTSIIRHDFVETNGDNLTLAIPLLTYVTFILLSSTPSQIHKWSHTYFGLPASVKLLQNAHIILPRKHHRIHHVSPHETYYCITTGWLNWPLEKIGFWRRLESVVIRFTGCKPRSDDLKWREKNHKN
ncbi:transmembrane protein 189 isoform X2 [Eurytemora carolleeae]|uniref:transmembrane protein 189 isoform X2 n=1 Tax=Eurytemora carolleeae TaxID=1294199 RepID=UPI000C78920B|nr:transmembrane protein 189 isoform X2 [Eurytemora carolleeae]|eukprot:XP_023344888.1 transmembrane protein 189-like isoform X2 [Eurytemora affinis]